MAEESLNPSTQNVIEMPGGITLTGMGGDPDALQETFEQRVEEQQPPTTAAPVAEPVAVAEPAKKTRGQKRFDELTAERETEKRRADAAEARAKDLEARLAPAAVVPAAQPVAVAAPTRPEPTEDEVGTKYQTYSAFVKDLAAWTVEQERTKLFADLDARSTQRIEDDRASRTRANYVEHTVFPAGRAAYQDFDAVLKAAGKVIVPYAVHDAVLQLPNPEHAIYALAKDETKVDEMIAILNDGQLRPDQKAVKIGIAVAQLMPREPVAPPASTAPVVRTTNATAPIQPVGASSRTTNPSIEEAALDSQEAYRRARGLRAIK